MLNIALLGLNHKTAPVELRELLAFSPEESESALDNIVKIPSINEVLLFSTCNRVELLFTSENSRQAIGSLKKFLADFKNIPEVQFEGALYMKYADDAVRHLFRVAASLDSMIVGEPQIIGQIKEAYRTATLKGASGVILNRLLHKSFFVAKRVRTETGIGDNAVSVSYAAVELAKKIFGNLEGKKVLLIGAGEMAELAVEHIMRNKAETILVANRTFDRGVELAEKFGGKAIRFEEIMETLKSADIIISSTGAPDYIITRKEVKGIIRSRRNRPLFFIDITVPRDIDPEIHHLANTYVYDIDDLKGVIEENIEDRKLAAVKGERIVDEAVIRFQQWYESLEVVPTIVALRTKLENIAHGEMKRTLQTLDHLTDDDREAIHRMTNALINKIMHDPTIVLKKDGCQGNKNQYLDIARKLFNLDD